MRYAIGHCVSPGVPILRLTKGDRSLVRGDGHADHQQDGGVTGADIATFFFAFEAGGC